jgi:hypothetical protein
MGKNKENKSSTIDSEMVQEKKISVSLTEYNKNAPFSFNAKNYRLLLIGLAINILGYILMIGGGTDDPAKFNGDELFSTMRITISPILIVAGFVVILYSIMRKPEADASE